MQSQLEMLQGSLKEKASSGKDLDQAIDQLKKSNLELELMAKEKEVCTLQLLSLLDLISYRH